MHAIALLITSLALAAPPPCTHSQLRLHVGPGNGTNGTIFHPLTFIDRSGRACTLRGYPGVSSVTRRHRQIGSPASRETGLPVRRVTLRAHGGAATAVYGQVDTGVFPRARCRPVRAWGLRVFAPGQTRAFFAHLPHEACSRRGAGDSHVRPVVRGRSGL
jgi:Protein of unknown function (DUF4232)